MIAPLALVRQLLARLAATTGKAVPKRLVEIERRRADHRAYRTPAPQRIRR